MEWIGCVCCEKFLRDFVARTFALVRPVSRRVSYGNQTVPNAPKQYETQQNVSLWSNGVDRVRLLRKITMRLRGTYFCTSSARIAPSFVSNQMVLNAPKCYETHQNSTRSTPLDPKLMFWGPMGWIGCFGCEKFRRDFVAQTFALVRPVFHRVS